MSQPKIEFLDYGRGRDEPRWVRNLPLICVIINLVLCLPIVICEIVIAIRNTHVGAVDAPLIPIFVLDFPSSLVANLALIILSDHWSALDNSTVAIYIVLSLLSLVLGVVQYYLLAKALRLVIRDWRRRRHMKRGHS
jgi:hypothetical protein